MQQNIAQLTQALHVGVIRSIAPLRNHPIDILARVLDVACLAMHTVLEINLKPWVFSVLRDDLIDARRAIALRGFGEFRQVYIDRHIRVFQMQMAGLVFFVVRH